MSTFGRTLSDQWGMRIVFSDWPLFSCIYHSQLWESECEAREDQCSILIMLYALYQYILVSTYTQEFRLCKAFLFPSFQISHLPNTISQSDVKNEQLQEQLSKQSHQESSLRGWDRSVSLSTAPTWELCSLGCLDSSIFRQKKTEQLRIQLSSSTLCTLASSLAAREENLCRWLSLSYSTAIHSCLIA